jgi:DNA-binding LacI/PurR family transcriptional regulator
MSRIVTSIDVAKRAGVSQATVSRVLNNPESVKPETREKVLRTIAELNYHPNLIARSLVTNDTKTIALVTPTLKNGYFVETIHNMVAIAKSRNYKTMVFVEDETDWRYIIDTVRGHKVAGILLSSLKYDDPMFDELLSLQIPYIQLSRRHRNGGNYVVLHNHKAAALITKHLLDLGHERIAYISGSTLISTFLERKIGFETAMEEAGLSTPAEYMYVIQDNPSEVQKIAWKLMHLPHPPTAIIGANDAIALTVMDAILSMGLKIPQDVSLAGMDTIEISAHFAIQLTSVGHQKFGIGEIAIENLIDLIEEKIHSPQQLVVMPELIIRKTTSRNNE